MARPLRRVCIQLSIRLKFPLEDIERWPISKIREYLALLNEQETPSKKSQPVREQTPDQIAASLGALLGNLKE